MADYAPRVMENREFVDLEEEDIQQLNRREAEKFDHNPDFPAFKREIESRLGSPGHWEEHWLTVDNSGRRVYARIYYAEGKGLAVTSDGRVIRELDYPVRDEPRTLH